MTNLDRSDDNDLLYALRHPLRRRILRAMAGKPAISPRELSTALQQPLSNVSYHVRVLAECSAVALVRTKDVRGSLQHFYLPTVKERWALEVLRLDKGPEDPEKPKQGEDPKDPKGAEAPGKGKEPKDGETSEKGDDGEDSGETPDDSEP
jgi:DNA-binding transcriptional ArsR family regulator